MMMTRINYLHDFAATLQADAAEGARSSTFGGQRATHQTRLYVAFSAALPTYAGRLTRYDPQ